MGKSRDAAAEPRARRADFLAGGGEMGARIREHDWAASPLGPVDAWPQSLRSAVSILLPSRAQVVLFWGPEFIAIYNDAYAPVFGAKHPWALGRPARECWSEVWPVLGPLFEGVVKTGEAFWAKEHPFLLHRQGFLEETYFDVSYDPVRIEDGSVGGVFCIVSEQTGRVLGERRLRTLRELGAKTAGAKNAAEVCREAAAALVIDPADVPFSLLYLIDDTRLRADLVALGGVEGDDLALAPAVTIAEIAALAAAREGEPAVAATGVFVRRPPSTAAEQVLVLPISSGTQIVGAMVTGVSRSLRLSGDYRDFFDLAAARVSAAIANARAYEEETRRAEALAELDRAKTAFFSNVSHEFRTPLTLLLGPVGEVLAAPGNQVSDDARALLTVAQRNGLRLQKLVNTLLDFARIEAGRVQAVFQPTDLAAATAELASNFRSACERAGLALEVDCPPLPEPVYVDREMWEKVVLNLLSNAFKFTFDGGIAVTLRSGPKVVELAIRDTGIGIPPEEIHRVFERFHRVEDARGRTQEGTGIGLALVQELVALHGGAVRIASVVDRGSTFTVSIPTGKAHLPADRIGDTRTLASTALGADPYVEEALRWVSDEEALPTGGPGPLPASREREGSPAGRPRILWADDNSDMRDYVRRLLSPHYEVEAVADGQAALAAARARRPDLVLSDVMMPRLDGFGLLRELRANPETRTLPVILLSARAGEEARVEGLEAGTDAYLVKPFSGRELLATIATRLELGRLRARLEQERAILADLFAQAPLPISLLRGPELVFDLANLACRRIVGNREILGKPLLEALPELRGQRTDELLMDVMKTGIPRVGHEALVKLDRRGTGELEDTYWTFIYAPFRDDRGQIDRVIAITSEVTEQVRSREALEALSADNAQLYEAERRARGVAEQANRTKDEFLATLSHELRTPLNAMLGWIRMLRSGTLDEATARRALEVVDRNVEHQAKLITDLLDISRIISGKLTLEMTVVDLTALVAGVVETMRPSAEAKSVAVTTRLVPGAVPIHADPERLRQVVANLLSNAVKFTPPAGRVTVALATMGDRVRLAITDTGKGISEQFLPHVFERFRQADASSTRAEAGLGLGLAIVRRIVELHNGHVRADSAGEGQGAVFTVDLPIATHADDRGVDAGDHREIAGAPTDLGGVHVLVVDDHADSRDLFAAILRRQRALVTTAENVRDALAAARRERPHVIVCDLAMPGDDGFVLIREVRSWTDPVVPALALTAYARPEDRDRVLAAGFRDHLSKPVDPRALLEAVARLAAGAAT
jgi:signal transduction histidine kinase